MRTGMFCAAIGTRWLLPLLPLLVSACSHGGSHCPSGACCQGSMACVPSSAPSPMTPALAAPGYGGQRTCPVSGAALGSAGPAIPVNVKGQTLYVCCQGCVAKVQADPDTYLARVAAEREGRPAPSSPPAQAPRRAALYGGQKTCPVTGEELAADGSAVAVTVQGQTIYVCCSGCAAKVKRNPGPHLAKAAAERSQVAGQLP